MFGAYYRLIKPRVMYGNLITTIAGFLFAAKGDIDWVLFAATTLGTALVISSACVINNYLDQDIDALMERTKSRPLTAGEISGKSALIFGIMLGLIGFAVLLLWSNWLVLLTGLVGWIVYVWLYGALGKRKSVHGTLVGSISGATPILAGYVAVTGQLDVTAFILFMILFLWQMPEFYSISIFRKDEYARAKVPVISVVKGVEHTKKEILLYTVLFVIVSLSLSVLSFAGWTYFIVMFLLGVRWLHIGVEGQITKDDNAWSKKMFKFSLVILVVFSVLISINSLVV